MKKKLLYLLIFTAVASVAFSALIKIKSNEIGPTLTVEEAIKKWGQQTFVQEAFLNGNASVRAAMAADLIKNNVYIGKKRKLVWEQLGPSTGYFWNDNIIPAYVLNDTPDQNNDHWQLIFLPGPNETISEVTINKNGFAPPIK